MAIGPGVIEGAGDISSVVGELVASKGGGAGGGSDWRDAGEQGA